MGASPSPPASVQLGAALLLCVATVTPLVHVFTYSGFDEARQQYV